ncbi:MAG: hypothetical protein IJ642_01620 [Oscillospiraceae bacterium]|nr:hypothetical protein [Oscillospiraceae bacterium]
MNKIHEIPDFFEKLFNTKPFSIVFSIICAMLIWFSVSVTTYNTTHVKYYNVPVSVDLSGTPADANGLSTVSCDVEKVTVQLEGNRSQIGRLKQEDLTAYLQAGNISTSGEYSFEISVRSSTDISFSIDNVVPSHATVKLDKIESKSFDVTASFPNIRVTSGHAFNKTDVTCEPSVIEITGPSAQLAEISKVEVYSDKFVEISSLYSLYTSEVRLYTEEGALMDSDQLKIPSTNFQIMIPVLTQKELALTYDIRNAFSGFDLNWLRERLHLSQESITLASQTNTEFVKRDSWNIGYVTLDDINLDFSEEMQITLSDEYINQSGFQQVTLALDNDGLASKEFWIDSDNIYIINAPKDYKCHIITRSMPITIIGDETELDQLSKQDIIVTVDLMNYNVQQSTTGSPDAIISISASAKLNTEEDAGNEEQTTEPSDENFIRLWAVGNYHVAVYFEEVTVPETEPSETAPETEDFITFYSDYNTDSIN